MTSKSSLILAAIGRAVLAHTGTTLDLSDDSKLAYSLVNSDAWSYPAESLPYVIIIAPAPTVTTMIHQVTLMSQDVTIIVYDRTDITEGITSLSLAQYDQDALTELRSIVWSIQDRDASGVDSIDINITDIAPQNLQRNYTGVGSDTEGNVTQYSTTFSIQYDEEY